MLAVTIFAVAAVALSFNDWSATRWLRNQVRENLRQLVTIAASQMDPSVVATISRPEQTGTPDYRRASAPLLKLRRLVPEIYDAYVFIVTPEGLRFTIDSTYYIQNPSAPASAVSVGDLSTAPSVDTLEAAPTGLTTVSTKPYTDAFGSFMSGFAAIRHNDGELVGFVGIDFSLAQLQRKEFPLLLTYLLGLVLATELSAQQRECLDIAQSSGEALLSLLNEILDSTKIESGSLQLDLAPCQLRPLLEDTVATCSSLALAEALQLSLLIGPEVPQSIRTDAIRLRLILLNLIGNAIKFTGAGSVVVSVEAAAGSAPSLGPGATSLSFCVTDTGVGIAADQIGLLFQPFRQLTTSANAPHAGTGLGLAISQQLVAALGGTIEVERTLGRGSEFRFHLPVQVAAAGPCASWWWMTVP